MMSLKLSSKATNVKNKSMNRTKEAFHTVVLILLIAITFFLTSQSWFAGIWENQPCLYDRQKTQSELALMVNPQQKQKRSVAKSALRHCVIKEHKNEWYKSQSKEDRILLDLFFGQDKCGGRYLEMGAYNGVKFSNSYMFHYGLDWNGVLIEASPRNFQQLKVNRPNETAIVHSGICDRDMDLHWVEASPHSISAESGFYEFAPEGRWQEEHIKNSQIVKCRPLTEILHETVGPGLYHFDFFSLDVEGAEFEVLKSLDFTEYSFGIVFVEADGKNPMKNMAARMLLESNGYTFFMERARSYWFVNQNWAEIYENVAYVKADSKQSTT